MSKELQGLLLVLQDKQQIALYEIRDALFVPLAYVPPKQPGHDDGYRFMQTTLAQKGYTRIVTFEQDDGLSGIYRKTESPEERK